jgi:hypothetical protein
VRSTSPGWKASPSDRDRIISSLISEGRAADLLRAGFDHHRAGYSISIGRISTNPPRAIGRQTPFASLGTPLSTPVRQQASDSLRPEASHRGAGFPGRSEPRREKKSGHAQTYGTSPPDFTTSAPSLPRRERCGVADSGGSRLATCLRCSIAYLASGPVSFTGS